MAFLILGTRTVVSETCESTIASTVGRKRKMRHQGFGHATGKQIVNARRDVSCRVARDKFCGNNSNKTAF